MLAGGGRVVDLSDPDRPVVLRDERLSGDALAELLAAIEAEVGGTLSVLVEAVDAHDVAAVGRPDPAWRYPDVVEAPRPRRVPRRRR